jgi:hypothetical protein
MSPDWLSYVLVRRFTLDANHAWVSLICMALGAATALMPSSASGWPRRTLRAVTAAVWLGLALSVVSGVLMFAKLDALAALTRLAYTGLELGLAVALLGAAVSLGLRIVAPAGEARASSAQPAA